MAVDKVIENIDKIFSDNKIKAGILRRTCDLNIDTTENLQTNPDRSFSSIDYQQPAQIYFTLKSSSKYLKIIHRMSSQNNLGKITLDCNSNSSLKNTFDLGAFNSSSIVYYCIFEENIDELVLSVFSEESFFIDQIELLEISKLEYKTNKLRQYSIKLINLIKKQPHLKDRFFSEIKANGIKPTLRKVKNKLYRNDNKNIISSLITEDNQGIVSRHSSDNNSILVISHDAHQGGATIVALHIVRILKEIFNKSVYVIFLQGGPLEKDFIKYAKETYNLNQSSLSYLENESELIHLLQQLQAKGVNSCISNSVVSAILLKKLNELKITSISLIHELPTSIKTYNFIQAANYAIKYSKSIIFPNNFVKDAFLNEFKLSEENVIIQPQGLFRKSDLQKSEAKSQLCKKLNIPLNSHIILSCGYGDLRKGLDLFYSVASLIINIKNKENIHFLWLGEREPILEKWLQHDAEQMKISNQIHLMGYESQPSYIFAGADLFLLTSREDPFPSVVLESLDNGTPVIPFENVGGASELVEKIGGRSIPYLQVNIMGEEILRLLEDRVEYNMIVRNARIEIDNEYDYTTYVSNLLTILEKDNYKQTFTLLKEKQLKVSVIVPNYNYEKYLPERLHSIITQEYPPYEIIFLDDKSIDNSINVAEGILKNSNIKYKIIENDVNLGCFGQWVKGIKEAEGDLIWIAEADDVCENHILSKLVPNFLDQEVNLSYAQSQIIDENSEKIDYSYTQYTKDLSEDKWLNNYCLDGREEIVHGLGIKNTIPNASAVLFRKTALIDIESELSHYKICGDWLTYAFALKKGKIAFHPEILNYHRRHSNSIISLKEQSSELYLELIKVKQFIVRNFNIPSSIKENFIKHIENEYERIGCKEYKDRSIYNNPLVLPEYLKLIKETEDKINSINYLQIKKKILFVAPDLEVGGGQMLVVRLANYLSAYQDVYIYNARPWLVNKQMVKMISTSVNILISSGDPNELRAYIENEQIEVINSHIWWSDKIVYKALLGQESDIKWIISMHGCYEMMLRVPDCDIEFSKIVEQMMNKANHIIYATDKNKEIFSKINLLNSEKLQQTYYGYSLQNIPPKSKEELSINENEFVYGLISRAIKEKGWEESIQAIIKLNKEIPVRSHLVLVGDSNYARDLKKQYSNYEYIHFVTEFNEPSEWIGWLQIFDVALLPTYYVSESLPNSIIEYLAYKKPVIATDIGDIKYMIYSKQDNKSAGILLQLNKNRLVEVDDLFEAMKVMLMDKEKFHEYKDNTDSLFKQFDMSDFASEYFKLF